MLLQSRTLIGLTKRVISRIVYRTNYTNGSRVHLRLLPSPKCLFDEPVQMKVEGLAPAQLVELRAKLTDDKGVLFKSSARYKADSNGDIHLDGSPSLSGSYTGVEPMGLFWSLKPETPHKKLWKKNAISPCLVDIEVFSCTDLEHALARGTIDRGFMSEGVRRLAVEDGRVRGVLFLPPGSGKYPAVLDMYVLGAGLSEVRASLLASKGFVVLALAYLNYADLPQSVSQFDLEYFEEALVYLQRRPEVKGPGVGILSISKSGDLALSMASFLPGISTTVCINGCNANTMSPLHYRGTVLPPLGVDASRIIGTKSGVQDVRDGMHDPMAEANRATLIPIERADCRFLFAASEDDRNWNSVYYAECAARRLEDHGRQNYEVVRYPKAGHHLDVPYMPLCPSSWHPFTSSVVAFGGDPKAHHEAQVDLWTKIQGFFRKHLEDGGRICKSAL